MKNSRSNGSMLDRILRRAAADGTERHVIAAFVEAVAVWHDIEAWGFTRDLAGRITREVSLPGSDDSSAPQHLAEFSTSSGQTVTRFTAAEAAGAGFVTAHPLCVLSVHPQMASPWLIAAAARQGCDTGLLTKYGTSLERALDRVAGVEVSRVTWAILQHLFPAADTPLEAAAHALHELSLALHRPAGALVLAADGREILAAGAPAAQLAEAPTRRDAELLSVPLQASAPYRGVLGVAGDAEHPITPRDERLLRAAVVPFEAWLRAAGRRLVVGRDRRAGARTFEHLVGEHEAAAARLHQDVSLIIIAVPADAAALDRTQQWVGRIRQQLRPTDAAGQLAAGDIAILLPQTTGAEAQSVADRLRGLMAATECLLPIAHAEIGLATFSGSTTHNQPLLVGARPRRPGGPPGAGRTAERTTR